MRSLWVLAGLGISVAVFTGWTSAATSVAPPRACTAADAGERAVLFADGSAPASQGHAYMRFCGAARAVVRVGGATYSIKGGRCGNRDAQTRWLWFGLLTDGSRPGAEGLSLVLNPANRDGRTRVGDSILQVGGLNLAPRGTAVQRDGLRVGTFTATWQGTQVTGSWVCGDAAFGKPTFHRVG
jgi:hypothetical protein